MKYIVPDYYKDFRCKCGECRHSCCDGWPIRISKKEYYRLLGIQCSAKLRAKLDCALKVCPNPSNECFAQITTDWRGTCMLHREDGLCALQVERGENSLPEVCKLYPRSTKGLSEITQCSCSNSCEATVELLLNSQAPIQFEESNLSLPLEFHIHLSPDQYESYIKSIQMMQNRSLPLLERFIALGNYLNGSDIYCIGPDGLPLAFQVMNVFAHYFEDSNSIGDYCKEVQIYFDIEDKDRLTDQDLNRIVQQYTTASKKLESFLPDWQLVFEQLIINHMFYNNFPYHDPQNKASDAFLSLTATYAFLRFSLLGILTDPIHTDKLVDFLAAMFRLIEHSDFAHIAVNLLKKEKYPIPQLVWQLLSI